MPNASLQLLPKAGAERTLEAVSCKALFGSAWGRDRFQGAPVLSVFTLQYRSA
jgi:hypothetical protein